jgi:hypothetical protein
MPVEACGANLLHSMTGIEGRAALIDEHDPASGIDLEVLSVSARAGARSTGVEAVLERVGVAIADGGAEIRGELLSVGVQLGTRSADGSEGVDIGAGAIVAGVEATLKLGGDSSLTLGASAGIGLHFSLGLRDSDHDGKPALCARISEFFTLAGCVELPW